MVCRKIVPCYFTTRAAKRYDRLIVECDELIAMAEDIDTSKATPIGDALEQAETIMDIAAPDAIRDEATAWRSEEMQGASPLVTRFTWVKHRYAKHARRGNS